MEDYSFLISDIEMEYKKYHDNLKKKYPKIRESIETSLKSIESLKQIILNKDDNNSVINFKNELNKLNAILLKPIYLVIDNKYTKLYLTSLSLLKKFVIYNLINNDEYNNIINCLKEIFLIQNEDIQLKVLEILQYIINGNVTKLTNVNIDNIMNICKIDNIKGHIKYTECKNAIKLILSILAKKIFDITEEKNVLLFIDGLFSSIIGIQKEWTSMTVQNSLIKSIKFEIIISILETYPDKFREGDANKYLEENMNNFIRKIFQMNNDQLIGIKLCRLVMIIVTVVKKNYLLLEEILKYLNKNNQIKWQKIIGLETLSELFKKPEILFDIYLNHIEFYKNIFENFTNITYNTIFLKSQKINDKKPPIPSSSSKNVIQSNKKQNDNNPSIIIPNKKYILNNNIFITENDQIMNISTNIEYIFKLLTDCYVHLKNSYIFLIEKNGININITSTKTKGNEEEKLVLNENQTKIKEMINYNFIEFKGGLIGMLLHINEVSSVQSFISIFQSFIYICTSFNLFSLRDELLNDLCKLALPNNLENVLEIKDKNILIIRAIFNLSHCTNLLEKNSWLIFIQTVQNLYFILIKSGYYLYNDKQQFNIDIIMKNIESNIKKYSIESTIMEVQKVVQEDEINKNINTVSTINGPYNKDLKNKKGKGINPLQNIRILTSEERENIDILSNVVNNLFSDSNDYDDNTLINIITALYEDTDKKVIIYNTQLKDTYNNISITENKRKNSVGDIQNKIEDNIQAQKKKNVGKLTVRNDLYKSVMDTRMIGKVQGGININANFQNEKIMINLSNINFNLVKIFGIIIINVNRINLLWDKILSIIKLFAFELNEGNNYSNTIFKFTAELLSYIIISIIIKYKNINNEEKENPFNEKNVQNTLFIPFDNLLNGYYNNFYINSSFMINPFKNIVDKCGTKLNIYGWNHLFEGINLILGNKKNIINSQEKENLFKIIEQIFNEYLDYLSIFNIEILLDVLEKFSINNEDKNICYSSISFFWQCADIIDNYQKNKKEMNGLELEIYKEKCSNDENRIKLYENLWNKLFSKLKAINNDKRFDIKKSGINLFAQFYVAKIKSINGINNISIDIINNIFFKIFIDNITVYLLNLNENETEEKKDTISNNNEINNQEKNNNDDNDEDSITSHKEEIVLFTLQNMGKVIKTYIEENKNNNNNKNQIEIINKLISIYFELIEKNNTPQITINILKNIGELESADKILFQENRNLFWEIIEKLANYINNKEKFLDLYSKSVKGSRVIQAIIESLTSSFYSKDDIEILNNKSSINNNINSFLEIIQQLFKSTYIMEKTLINIDPYNIINTEKNIYNLIEIIGSYCKNSKDVENILNYLLKSINYNKDDKHSIAISGQSMKSLGIIISHNNTLLNDIEEEKIKKNIMECKEQTNYFFDLRNNKILAEELTNHNIKKKDRFIWENMIVSFNDYILKSIFNKIKDEKTWDEILNYLIKLYKDCREEKIDIKNTNNDDKKDDKDIDNEINIKEEESNKNVINIDNKENNNNIINNNENKDVISSEMIKSNRNIEKNIINFIINILLPNSGYISENIQQKILQLLDIESDNDNNNKDILDNNSPKIFSINQMNTENLFNICNFKGEEEIQKEFSNQFNNEEQLNSIKQYIEIKKKISKKILPILFKICKDKIDEFIESERNIGNANPISKRDEILMILDSLKNLDSYCSELEFNQKNEIIKSCINNKKGHLFILHHYFNKLIFSKNEAIKTKIYDIFEIIASQINSEELS